MAVRQFAIPLNDASIQTGNITFKDLNEGNAPVNFNLSHVVTGGSSDELNLITMKDNHKTDHTFSISVVSGTASVQLSAEDISKVYEDADEGDWDYVEAHWTIGSTDTPITSVLEMVQSGRPYDYVGWPPKQPH